MTLFETNIITLYREKGKVWLQELPTLLNKISSTLGLQDLKPVSALSYHYVLSGFQDTTPIILKIGLDTESLKREAFALQCFAGYGAVTVVTASEGFFILERAIPGISLKHFRLENNMLSIEIACTVMKKLHNVHVPEHHPFPHIQEWLSALDKDWAIPLRYLKKARKIRDRLLDTEQKCLLHGDLHRDNILLHRDAWVVIDPKGVIGSPINDMWAFVVDIEHDIPFIAQYFDFKVQEVFDWYFVHVLLASCWNIEDNSDPTFFLKLAQKAYCNTTNE